MSYIAFLCVSIFREVFLECLPGVLVELGTIIVSESVEQSTPADMVSSDVSNTWGINTGGGTYSTFFSMSYWVNLLPKIPVADPKKNPTCNSLFSLYIRSLYVYSRFIRLHSVIWYPSWPLWQSSANKFFLPGMWAAWITIPGFTPVKYLPNKATQLKGHRPLPYWKNMTPLLSCLNRIHALQQCAFEMNQS